MKKILLDISPDSFVGQEMKYDNSFLDIEQEIDKFYSVNTEESTDWASVKNNCYTLLSTRSKDFKMEW